MGALRVPELSQFGKSSTTKIWRLLEIIASYKLMVTIAEMTVSLSNNQPFQQTV
jgi:hypothetical protein